MSTSGDSLPASYGSSASFAALGKGGRSWWCTDVDVMDDDDIVCLVENEVMSVSVRVS